MKRLHITLLVGSNHTDLLIQTLLDLDNFGLHETDSPEVFSWCLDGSNL